MTRPLLTILLLCFGCKLFSQSTQTIYYTVKEGLPSNSVYRTILDDRGFLWVATENGIARFDGKKFDVGPEIGAHYQPHFDSLEVTH